MRILTFTTLYPDCVRPRHGIFVETRLRHLVKDGEIRAHVVAPVPWFPFKSRWFGTYAQYACVPSEEVRHGLHVSRPRYPLAPRMGMTSAPLAMALATYPLLRRMRRSYDVIDAHYFYPDGVAAALLGEWLCVPVVITARGTDVNVIPSFPLPRRMILWASKRAAHVITVCQALRDKLIFHGADAAKITVLRNGVDLERFRPVNRDASRRLLGLTRTTLLSVGNFLESKGHHIAIEALAGLPDCELLVVGDGKMEAALRELAIRVGVAGRARFLGAMGQEELRAVYTAADMLVLASSREGWPNVLLEAMACGTPVIATRIGGMPEVVQSHEAGILMDARSPRALIEAVRGLRTDMPDRAATRRYSERFSWEATTQGQKAIFARILAGEALA